MVYTHIKINALFRMAWANLKFKRLRNGLTIIGIMIGVGSVYTLMSFGIGLQNLVEKQVTDGLSINTIDISARGSRLLTLDDEAIKNIAAVKNVESATGIFASAGKLTVSKATADVVTYGVDEQYLKTTDVVIQAGKALNPSQPDQVAISSTILDALGIRDPKTIIGTKVDLKVVESEDQIINKQFTVVGVISSGSGSEAFVSSDVFKKSGFTKYAQAKATSTSRENVPDARKAIESLGYDTASPLDTVEQVDQFFRILRSVLIGFGGVGMVIAVLGMVNTMTVSLLERTREVALMLALGARPGDMKNLFVIEAVTLSLIGGILGIIGSFVLSLGIDAVLNNIALSRGATANFTVFANPWWLILSTLVFMTLVGLLVAYLPARRASHINSIEAMRNE